MLDDDVEEEKVLLCLLAPWGSVNVLNAELVGCPSKPIVISYGFFRARRAVIYVALDRLYVLSRVLRL